MNQIDYAAITAQKLKDKFAELRAMVSGAKASASVTVPVKTETDKVAVNPPKVEPPKSRGCGGCGRNKSP